MTSERFTVIACGGIGESGPDDRSFEVKGMLKNVTDKLDPLKFESQWCPWEASYGPVPKLDGDDYDDSLERGIERLVTAIRQCPNDVVGLGYSAGATLWGRLLELMEEGYYRDISVVGVAFIAHPERREGDSCNNVGTGWGIGGEWLGGPDKIPTFEIADPADVICCCPTNSPLRTFADQTSSMSFLDIHGWAVDLRDRLINNRWQAVKIEWWNPVAVFRQYTQAANDILGYAARGDHVSYHKRIMPGETVTYTTKLAQVLNASRFG